MLMLWDRGLSQCCGFNHMAAEAELSTWLSGTWLSGTWLHMYRLRLPPAPCPTGHLVGGGARGCGQVPRKARQIGCRPAPAGRLGTRRTWACNTCQVAFALRYCPFIELQGAGMAVLPHQAPHRPPAALAALPPHAAPALALR